jgi:hypothetical protein
MFFNTAVGLIALSSHALAREMVPNVRTEAHYKSGAFMQQIMESKEVHHITLWLLILPLTRSRQHSLVSEQLVHTILSNTQGLTILSHVSMALQLPFLEMPTTHSAAAM